MLPQPATIIHCPDCGVECHYVANCYADMPSTCPGNYCPHQRGGQGCLERQVRNLKTRIKQLTDPTADTKYLFQLTINGYNAVVIDYTPGEACQRAFLYDPHGDWKDAATIIITRVRVSMTNRVVALERQQK